MFKSNIPLSRPDITLREREEVLAVLKSPFLSLGPRVPEFEEKFKAFVGTKHAVAVNSGTSGLHLAVRAVGIKAGDRVLTTPFSFVASANCLLYEGAHPAFVDIDEGTWNLDVNLLRRKLARKESGQPRYRAILPVHVFGRPCDMDGLMELAERHGLDVLEDACEAVGAKYLSRRAKTSTPSERRASRPVWRKAGTFGRLGVFAFYPNKQMTTGEGGLIVTDEAQLASACRSMRNQGRREGVGWLQHERLGYNYRLSDLQCALGIAQLARIEEMLLRRDAVARSYGRYLDGIEEIIIPRSEQGKVISWFVYVVRLADRFSRRDRDAILRILRSKGIECSDYFQPIHLQPFYRRMYGFRRGDFPVAEKISDRTIALPFYNSLNEKDLSVVVRELKEALVSLRPGRGRV